ncbi:DMAC1 protein, partial [Tricholaema leucomelas]|nr:DMAC1 protein [Tricholaema leucomelas]
QSSAPAAVPLPVPVPVPAAPSAAPSQLFGGCLGCRLLSGSALLLAALWIYQGPRSSMRRGIPPSMAAIAQITFAISEGRGREGEREG